MLIYNNTNILKMVNIVLYELISFSVVFVVLEKDLSVNQFNSWKKMESDYIILCIILYWSSDLVKY